MNLIKLVGVCIVILMVAVLTASPVLAQPDKGADTKVVAVTSVPFGGAAMGAGLGAGLVVIGAAYGFGKIGAAALESMARQPETANKVQTAMIIIGALLEGATFFALIICIQIANKA